MKLRREIEPKYRYYFFDYLYYKGEKWSEKAWRSSGMMMLAWYWWLNVAIPAAFIMPLSWGKSLKNYLGLVLIVLPIVFCIIRYRKGRKIAIMFHYKHLKNSGFTIALLILLSVVIFIIEMWILEKGGWVH